MGIEETMGHWFGTDESPDNKRWRSTGRIVLGATFTVLLLVGGLIAWTEVLARSGGDGVEAGGENLRSETEQVASPAASVAADSDSAASNIGPAADAAILVVSDGDMTNAGDPLSADLGTSTSLASTTTVTAPQDSIPTSKPPIVASSLSTTSTSRPGSSVTTKPNGPTTTRAPVPAPSTRPPTTRLPTTRLPTTRLPTTRPVVTRPPTTRPAVTRPPTTRPVVTRPVVTQPPTTRPPTTRPPTTRLPTTRPTTTRPPTTQPPATHPPGHGSSGSWVKVGDEHATYRDGTQATTHYLFDPFNPKAPAGWGASRIGFLVHCDPVKTAQVDPIVAPGMSRSAHLHEFFGNPSVNANSTTQSLADTPLSKISCTDKNDKSGYWSPVAYQGGQQRSADHFKAYYKAPNEDSVPIPFGLRMVAGDAHATKNQPAYVGWWQTSESRTTAGQSSMISTGGALLTLRINFPQCWDGKHLDSPDHKSHMSYTKGGSCPSSHPVRIPQVVTFTDYKTAGGTGLTLASGAWYTFHQDFWNAWSPKQMANLNKDCNLAGLNCRARKSPDLVPRGQYSKVIG